MVLVWKRERFASNRSATACSAFSALFFVFGVFDPNFRLIVTKPDNVPIVGLIFLLVFFVWYSIREAVLNDRRIAAGKRPIEKDESDRERVWPDLVYTELIADRLTVVLIGWSMVLKAPLEEPANPSNSPNPSKAPWYFLGLQEMLVYFDPWLAGVVLPGLIIVGLICIPYIDKNPKGNGYYTFNERKAEIAIFLFGFLCSGRADRARHVPARTELELLRPVRVLGHPQARSADQRQSVGIYLGAGSAGAADAAGDPRDLRHPVRAVLLLRDAAAVRAKKWFKLLRQARPDSLSRDDLPVPDDDVAAAQDARCGGSST